MVASFGPGLERPLLAAIRGAASPWKNSTSVKVTRREASRVTSIRHYDHVPKVRVREVMAAARWTRAKMRDEGRGGVGGCQQMSENASYVRTIRVNGGMVTYHASRSECSDDDGASGVDESKRLAKAAESM